MIRAFIIKTIISLTSIAFLGVTLTFPGDRTPLSLIPIILTVAGWATYETADLLDNKEERPFVFRFHKILNSTVARVICIIIASVLTMSCIYIGFCYSIRSDSSNNLVFLPKSGSALNNMSFGYNNFAVVIFIFISLLTLWNIAVNITNGLMKNTNKKNTPNLSFYYLVKKEIRKSILSSQME